MCVVFPDEGNLCSQRRVHHSQHGVCRRRTRRPDKRPDSRFHEITPTPLPINVSQTSFGGTNRTSEHQLSVCSKGITGRGTNFGHPFFDSLRPFNTELFLNHHPIILLNLVDVDGQLSLSRVWSTDNLTRVTETSGIRSRGLSKEEESGRGSHRTSFGDPHPPSTSSTTSTTSLGPRHIHPRSVLHLRESDPETWVYVSLPSFRVHGIMKPYDGRPCTSLVLDPQHPDQGTVSGIKCYCKFKKRVEGVHFLFFNPDLLQILGKIKMAVLKI